MPRFTVTLSIPVTATVEVEADDEESAEDKARDDCVLQQLVGNGGMDKIVGVDASNVSLCPDSDPDLVDIVEEG